jgi:hypothetical protein
VEQEPGGEPRDHEAGARQRLLPVARRRVETGGRCRRRHARERLEVESEIVRRVKARLGILLEAVVDDALEARVDLAVGRRELGRSRMRIADMVEAAESCRGRRAGP